MSPARSTTVSPPTAPFGRPAVRLSPTSTSCRPKARCNFEPGETNKTFTITLLDDGLFGGDESFSIVLDQATGGVPISTPEVKVTIRNNDRIQCGWTRTLIRIGPCFLSFLRALAAPLLRRAVRRKDTAAHTQGSIDWRGRRFGAALVALAARRIAAWKAPTISGSVVALIPLTNGQVLIAAWGLSGPDFTVDGVSRRSFGRVECQRVGGHRLLGRTPGEHGGLLVSVAVQGNGQILVAVATNPAPTTSPPRLIVQCLR